jgi:hypothetical protein
MYGTDGSVVGQAIGNWDSTPFGYQAEGDEGPEVMWEQDEFVSVRDGSARDAIADEYMDMGEDYDDAEDYARRAAKKMSAEGASAEQIAKELREAQMKDMGKITPGNYGRGAVSNHHTKAVFDKYGAAAIKAAHEEMHNKKMSAEGLGDYTGPLTNGFGENSASVSDYGVPVWYGSAEEAYNGMGENSASISGQGVPQWYGSAETADSMSDEEVIEILEEVETSEFGAYQKYPVEQVRMAMSLVNSRPSLKAWAQKRYSAEELGVGVGMPAVDDGFYPNSYGEDSSTFGQGVPQWYGSAEQGYDDKMDESLGMRHRGPHSQSMKDRRDEAAAMDKDHSMMGRKYDDVMTMDAEPVVKVQKSETKMAMAIGAAVLGALTAYTLSRKVGTSAPEEPEEEPEE